MKSTLAKAATLGVARVDSDVNEFLYLPYGMSLLAFSRLWHIECGVRPSKEKN